MCLDYLGCSIFVAFDHILTSIMPAQFELRYTASAELCLFFVYDFSGERWIKLAKNLESSFFTVTLLSFEEVECTLLLRWNLPPPIITWDIR